MFGFFERLVDPFANGFSPVQPNTVRRFIIKEIYGLKKFMLLVAIGSMCIAATEVYIFKYLGGLVDAMENTDQFFSNNIGTLIQICFVLLVGLPLVILFHTLFWQQALEGNFPLRVLSSAHQYLLKHRIQFYQVEAAGKVANTLLQTTASIRHVVLKLIDTFMYAFVFFVSMGLMLSSLNLYLLAPIGLWLIGYVFVISYFVPKLKFWSNKQASARSEMVGQLVDTYSNIVTVKLFSHSSIEKNYAQQYMSKYLRTVYGQARFISTVLFLMWLLNIMLIFGTTAMSLYLWSKGTISIGAIAAAIGVVFRVYTMSHWIMWEVSGLFGHLGVIQDGIKLLFKPLHESIGQKRPPLDVAQFNISFKDVAFSYMGESNVIDGLSIDIKSGEKIGIIGKH